MSNQIGRDEIIQQLIRWGEGRENVRAAILTSTRANPDARLDRFSDYDVILAVTDSHPYFDSRDWLSDFGPVLVLYRDPLQLEYGFERFAYITQYENGLKIDFSLWPVGLLQAVVQEPELPDYLDVGYRVLLDKDGLAAGLKPPSFRAFIPKPPSQEEYGEAVEVFWHEATYVAKNLWRRELLPAKYSLDSMMKLQMLRQMLEWLVECENGWAVKTGAYGKGLQRHVQPDIWKGLESTYVGAGREENWEALFNTCDLYRRVAIRVGEQLGYPYPLEMDRRVEEYLHGVHRMALAEE
jgi:aminoglycoside 6-adenylyltransferase